MSSAVVLQVFAIDVIHALAFPAIAAKIDAIPGRVAGMTVSFAVPGLLRGQCSELCGTLHSFMPLELSVL